MTDTINGKTYKCKFGCGTINNVINKIDGETVETFIYANGDCQKILLEAISRLTSLALRNGISIEKVRNELTGEGVNKYTCGNEVWRNGKHINCMDRFSDLL